MFHIGNGVDDADRIFTSSTILAHPQATSSTFAFCPWRALEISAIFDPGLDEERRQEFIFITDDVFLGL